MDTKVVDLVRQSTHVKAIFGKEMVLETAAERFVWLLIRRLQHTL